MSTKFYAVNRETGEIIKAKTTSIFLQSVFFKNSPLHDGAVIIDGNFITAARVILPVSENKNINSRLGLRHRAAFGITEKTDAIAIVISEENGKINFIAIKITINNPTLQLFANFIQSIPEETKIQLLASSTNKSSLKSQPSINDLTRQPKLNSTSSKVEKKTQSNTS